MCESELDLCRCGGEAKYDSEAFSDSVYVVCTKCGTRTRTIVVSIHDAKALARKKARAVWNCQIVATTCEKGK